MSTVHGIYSHISPHLHLISGPCTFQSDITCFILTLSRMNTLIGYEVANRLRGFLTRKGNHMTHTRALISENTSLWATMRVGAVGVSDGIPLFITGQVMCSESIILAVVSLLQIIWIDYNREEASMHRKHSLFIYSGIICLFMVPSCVYW